MFKFNKIIFMIMLIMSSLISISSYSWFSMWLGLEINLLTIIPLFMGKSNKYPSESMMKYFFIQALASTMILYSILMSFNLNSSLISKLSMMLNSALLMKMGAAPFHFWFPEIIEGLTWNNALIVLTWQKLAPMIMLSYSMMNSTFICFSIILSSIISGIQGLNQISVRKIMAYSSINHNSWMISNLLISTDMWVFYFVIYSLISINLIYTFKLFKINMIQQLMNILNYNKLIKISMLLNFLSLGGLPPFIGFLPKWLTIYFMVENNLFFLTIILIMCTLIALYFYLRLILSTMSFKIKENLIISLKKMNMIFLLMNSINLMSLIMASFISI
uniref:NADH-ubiquinone oxidoreductase chain 2 n=1 Tax=Sitophilus zeamais TaxID=7047 RepID=A0A1B1UUK7_SITZE|nr:NADH dehydrogenase subunit 2 [Sitophilus zeamais]ANW06507.1 NADH dehydrogenase subunit 2 [Sitophilus zeamais]AOS50524.1 NADH dehydrogenase subunit 2 [Sitophilus zeamais]QJA14873.1 NADH dehydrogenase subunit 2 [Sitophilus zeamais]QKE47552.1 NADH dehydrogenase subunit 2 [Sitophilus zeamais]